MEPLNIMETKEKNTEYERVSDEIQDIIGQIPPWIVRWGISVLFGVVIIILIIANSISFPDIIIGESQLQAKEKPRKISWFISSRNEDYAPLVKEGQKVKVGDSLVVEQASQKKTYFRSSVAGTVSFSQGYKENADKRTIWVVPEIKSYEVLVKIPVKNSGKVKVGQQVKISLDEFSQNEFGFVVGKIVSVLPVKIEGQYRVNVELTNGLVTNTGYKLEKQPAFMGKAEIILDEKSILYRIFGGMLGA